MIKHTQMANHPPHRPQTACGRWGGSHYPDSAVTRLEAPTCAPAVLCSFSFWTWSRDIICNCSCVHACLPPHALPHCARIYTCMIVLSPSWSKNYSPPKYSPLWNPYLAQRLIPGHCPLRSYLKKMMNMAAVLLFITVREF